MIDVAHALDWGMRRSDKETLPTVRSDLKCRLGSVSIAAGYVTGGQTDKTVGRRKGRATTGARPSEIDATQKLSLKVAIGSSQERALLLGCGSIAVGVAHEGADWILERASRYVLAAARIGIRPAMRGKRYEAYAGLGADGLILLSGWISSFMDGGACRWLR